MRHHGSPENRCPARQARGKIDNMLIQKRMRYAYVMIAPFFIVFLIFKFYPMLYSVYLSFCDMNPLSGALTWIGGKNYERFFTSPYFIQSIGNTLLIWIVSIIPQLTIAFTLSLLLHSKWLRGRSVLRNVYYFPNLVTPVTIALLFYTLFVYPGGSVNQIIALFGFEQVDFQNNPPLARLVISLAICWKNFGFNIIYFTAALHSIPGEIYEASEIDGVNALQKTAFITIPMMRPILLYIMVTSIIGGLQIFDESKLVFKDVPGNAATTMVKYLYDSAFDRFQFGYGAAVAVGIFFIILMATGISLLFTRQWKTSRKGA
jgi:ABC-type sugar transport system permease subunit